MCFKKIYRIFTDLQLLTMLFGSFCRYLKPLSTHTKIMQIPCKNLKIITTKVKEDKQ